ncbi:MAG: GGDEF domain-containing protein [Thioalkalispiraceae bacterium]|jgi:diguanylate cyclase (GGDEF)-like protein
MQPGQIQKLSCLVAYSDEVFEYFYSELLSNQVFSKYFNNTDQVQALLTKQKDNYHALFRESKEELRQRYYRIGKIHYRHDIPYGIILSGIHILRDKFNEVIEKHFTDMELCMLNDKLFDFISETMARGYMDVYTWDEKTDLEKILRMTANVTFGTEKQLLIKHYTWILDLLEAVNKEDFDAERNLVEQQTHDRDTLYSYIIEHLNDIDQTMQAEEIERIRFRIVANTENIFFYLKRKSYSEVLTLIINILEIYKLTLVLDNVISNIIVRKAESVISEKVKLSETDPLTNILNRRKFEEILEGLILRAHRTTNPLTIMILDIDDFKHINDEHGHQTGDDVLVKMSRLLAASIRKNDHLLRYGGEEFVIISADSNLEGVQHLAEKIRKDIAEHAFDGIGQVTVSIGLAQLDKDDDKHSFFKRADKKLYEAKANGKNCVCY